MEEGMPKIIVRFAVLIFAVCIGWEYPAAQSNSPNPVSAMPVFELDPNWPRIPNGWVFGATSSVAVDKRDHVWILQRPGTVTESQRSHAAPPVLEYDANGKFLNAWGGAGAGHDWPVTEHGITVDVDKTRSGLPAAAFRMTFCCSTTSRGIS
jgi:hypothetical protein